MKNSVNQCNSPQNKFMSKYVGVCNQVKYGLKEKFENQCNTPQNKFISKYVGSCNQVKYNKKN